jgi:hypothetical protein
MNVLSRFLRPPRVVVQAGPVACPLGGEQEIGFCSTCPLFVRFGYGKNGVSVTCRTLDQVDSMRRTGLR